MPSNEPAQVKTDDEVKIPTPGSKRRRLQGACDICRRKKIKCDSAKMPGNRCSHCIAFNSECTHTESDKKRAHKKTYVEDLEDRVQKLEQLIQKLSPDTDLTKEIESLPRKEISPEQMSTILSHQTTSGVQDSVSSSSSPLSFPIMSPKPSPIAHETSPSDQADDEEDFAHEVLAEEMRRLNISPAEDRYFGKSSHFHLLHTAIDIKRECPGHENTLKGGEFKRPEFWELQPWETEALKTEMPSYFFPEGDLLTTLVDLYFKYINPFIPLFHRATFERSLVEGLHYRDTWFGAVVLTVCAIASRYSDDPRVFLEGTNSEYSCGWKWFNQVQPMRKSPLVAASLYELQFYSLSVIYYQGTSQPQACWIMIGLGIRYAQEVGAHKRRHRSNGHSVEEELWKRAFWTLIMLDRLVSSIVGRPSAIQEEDFDIDLPLECDDEYWEHPDPSLAFKQPPSKPSMISYFVTHLKLCEIVGFALRTIFSTNKSKLLVGVVGPEWEQRMVAELDSALNKWLDSVPDHLRWDPHRDPNSIFFNQSASLYVAYYTTQIQIHRPFIGTPHKPSPLNFPSLAICTNAARSCCHLMDVQSRKGMFMPLPHFQIAAFTSAIVLLVNIWGARRSGISINPNKEMLDVQKCMLFLKMYENRWRTAGRLCDFLQELASMGDLRFPQPDLRMNKRQRDAEDSTPAERVPGSTNEESSARFSSTLPRTESVPSTTFGYSHAIRPMGTTSHPADQAFQLPMSSDELGRIPVHDSFSFPEYKEWFPPPQASLVTTSLLDPQLSVPTHADAQQSTSASFDGLSANLILEERGDLLNATPSHHGLPSRAAAFSYPSSTGVQEPWLPLNQNQLEMWDNNAMALWSNVPTGFDLEDWNTYIASANDVTGSTPQAAQALFNI